MARTSQKAKRSEKPLTSWTRFHLPRYQEWPTWSVNHDDVHVGPLKGVEGWRTASLGRMVDKTEQAAYIIQWVNLDALKNFQYSPACAEFLQNLPEHDDSQASVESGSTLGNLNLTDASSSSAPATSRFLIFKHVTPAVTAEVEGRVTLTAFLVPRKVDSVFLMWKEKFESVFAGFIPRGYEFITWHPNFMFRFAAVWLWVLSEDGWVEKKFGKLEQTPDGDQGRTIICHFHLWRRECGATPEKEEASAADPQSRESWNRAVAQVMPPATSWVQERWDIQDVPRPPEPEFDPEALSEYDKEQERRIKLFFEARGLEKDESSE
ncbi:hypothetical protein CI238_12873 [Colletotrichum incanum]|uniref:Uncharacterized protein n=1 Tax=Colletotrichum incanum TaxID=1573173 RepID=A0A167E310_COLIC|nr:hypothetical protein CI238_12873 [Colletotrichum incanum]